MVEEPAVVTEETSERAAPLRRVAIHTALLFGVLLVLIPVLSHGDGIGFPDEGVYAAQVQSVARGTWLETRPAVDLRGTEVLNGIGPEFIDGDRYAGYVRHSLYIRALVPFYRAFGFAGLIVFSAFGTALAGMATAMFAARLAPLVSIPSLWVLGIGSPLLFDGEIVAAHSMAAALCGGMAVALVAAARNRSRVGFAVAPLLGAAAVLLRTEGVLAVASSGVVTAGLGAIGLVLRRRSAIWPLLAGAAVALVAGLAFLLDARLAVAVSGTSHTTATTSRILGQGTGPWSQLWVSIVRPWYSAERRFVPEAVAALAVVLAAVSIHVAPRHRLVPITLVAAGAIAAVVQNILGATLITGLAAALPILPAGLLLLRRPHLRNPVIAVALVASVLTAFGLFLTAYSSGGAAEWGGRFYHVLVPVLLPIALLGWQTAVASWPRVESRMLLVGLVVVCLAFSTLALRINSQNRANSRAYQVAAARFLQVGPGRPPLLVTSGLDIGGASRSLWSLRDSVDVLTVSGFTDTFRLVRFAAANGYPRVYVMSLDEDASVREVARVWLGPIRWTVHRSARVAGLRASLYEFGPLGRE